ncbi:quinohemoprotein amine dehydrogenase maturase, partial [Pseudomonas soli]|nr:quinohemoprotein amine dehydrogenase maturase [Pseudomonas soli]
MGALLNLVERNLHEVQVDADRMLFHIPSSSLFATDAVTGGIIDTLRRQGCSAEELLQQLGQQFDGQDIEETLRELIALEVVSDGSPLTPEIALKQVERTALN